MIKTVTTVFILFCLILTGLHIAVSATETGAEQLTTDLKKPVEGYVYQDAAFFNEADGIIRSLSQGVIPTGEQRMNVSRAYSRLQDMSISPDNYDTAKTILAFLYNTAKGGEAYENYTRVKNSGATVPNGSEQYNLADTSYQTASDLWALIADRYPDVTLYSLPKKEESSQKTKSEAGAILEGMKYPLVALQVTPNSSKPYQDEKIKKTIQYWVEDYINAIPDATTLNGQSPGNYFITSDGPRWAKGTAVDLSRKNVNPDFYDTANYINAFLYFISQAHEYYDEYLDERSSIFMDSDGREPYEMSKTYYEQAGIAFSRFKDQIPAINKSTTLPEFPWINEIEMGRTLEKGNLGLITEENIHPEEESTYTSPTWYF